MFIGYVFSGSHFSFGQSEETWKQSKKGRPCWILCIKLFLYAGTCGLLPSSTAVLQCTPGLSSSAPWGCWLKIRGLRWRQVGLLYSIVLYYIVLHCIVLYFIALYCILIMNIFFCFSILLKYSLLFYSILFYSILFYSISGCDHFWNRFGVYRLPGGGHHHGATTALLIPLLPHGLSPSHVQH